MKKYLAAIVIAIVLLAGGGFFAYVHFQRRSLAGHLVGRAGRRRELVRRPYTEPGNPYLYKK